MQCKKLLVGVLIISLLLIVSSLGVYAKLSTEDSKKVSELDTLISQLSSYEQQYYTNNDKARAAYLRGEAYEKIAEAYRLTYESTLPAKTSVVPASQKTWTCDEAIVELKKLKQTEKYPTNKELIDRLAKQIPALISPDELDEIDGNFVGGQENMAYVLNVVMRRCNLTITASLTAETLESAEGNKSLESPKTEVEKNAALALNPDGSISQTTEITSSDSAVLNFLNAYSTTVDEYSSIICSVYLESEQTPAQQTASAAVSGGVAAGSSFAAELAAAESVVVESGSRVIATSSSVPGAVLTGSTWEYKIVQVAGRNIVVGGTPGRLINVIGEIGTGGKVMKISSDVANAVKAAQPGYNIASGSIGKGTLNGFSLAKGSKLLSSTGVELGKFGETGQIVRTASGVKFISVTSKFFSVIAKVYTALTFYQIYCVGMQTERAFFSALDASVAAQDAANGADTQYWSLVIAAAKKSKELSESYVIFEKSYSDSPEFISGCISELEVAELSSEVQRINTWSKNLLDGYNKYYYNEDVESSGIWMFRTESKITTQEGKTLSTGVRNLASALNDARNKMNTFSEDLKLCESYIIWETDMIN